MTAILRTVFLLAVASVCGGCSTLEPPHFFHPGPAPQQQLQAQRFDPYPDATVGPEVQGGRPLGFENPISEPAKSRWLPASWYRRNR